MKIQKEINNEFRTRENTVRIFATLCDMGEEKSYRIFVCFQATRWQEDISLSGTHE